MKKIHGFVIAGALALSAVGVSALLFSSKDSIKANASTDISEGKIFIGGTDIVTAPNQTINDSDGGTVKLEGHTLTFTNYDYEGMGKESYSNYFCGVYIDAEYDMEFVFVGENSIIVPTSTEVVTSKQAFSVKTNNKNFIFKGDGSLSLSTANASTTSTALSLENETNTTSVLTFDGPNISMVSNNPNGSACGFSNHGTSYSAEIIINHGEFDLDITAKSSENSTGFSYMKKFTMNGGIVRASVKTGRYVRCFRSDIDNSTFNFNGGSFYASGTGGINSSVGMSINAYSSLHISKNVGVFEIKGDKGAVDIGYESKIYNATGGKSWTNYEGTEGETIINPSSEGQTFDTTVKKLEIKGLEKAVYTTEPTAKEGLFYTGEAQALVNAGSSEQGVVVYRLEGSEEFSNNIPTATEEGSYVVEYKIVADDSHTDSEIKSVEVIIGAASNKNGGGKLQGWAIALIVVGGVLGLACLCFLVMFFALNKWIRVGDKAVRVIRLGSKDGKVKVLTSSFKVQLKEEKEVFKSKADALK